MWVNFCSYMAGHFNQLNKPYDMSHTELVLPMSFADEFCYNMEFTFRIPFEEDFEPWVKRVSGLSYRLLEALLKYIEKSSFHLTVIFN